MLVCRRFKDVAQPLQYQCLRIIDDSPHKRTHLRRTLEENPDLGKAVVELDVDYAGVHAYSHRDKGSSRKQKPDRKDWWRHKAHMPSSVPTLFPNLCRVRVDIESLEDLPYVPTNFAVPRLQWLAVTSVGLGGEWPPKASGVSNMHIDELMISITNLNRNGSALGLLPTALAHIEGLVQFQYECCARSYKQSQIPWTVKVPDLLEALLAQSQSLVTLCIATSDGGTDGGNLLYGDGDYNLSPFVKLKHLVIATKHLSNVAFDKLSSQLEELQFQEHGSHWDEQFITLKLKALLHVIPRHLPRLKLVVLGVQERGEDFYERKHLYSALSELESLTMQFEHLGVCFQFFADPHFYRVRPGKPWVNGWVKEYLP